ncbi:MAG: 3'-5' exonuclease [Desulfocapsa sp.]|nr:3'-5' exonuclease [Desulfocapsa sp.]
MGNYSVIVLDFETTGLSPNHGDRAIEIGAVLIENNRVVDSFQKLMNPGFRISSFIESYTNISNSMVEKAAPCEEVMVQFADFIGDYPLVAHNASFDRRFLDSEFQFIGRARSNPIACSMLASRRIYPHAFNHQLGTLVDYCDIENDGTFHRALADAQMTGHLWISMIEEIKSNYGLKKVPFTLMQKISKISKTKVCTFLEKEGRKSRN